MPATSEAEKAYIAGLVDGEGCITIIRHDQSKHSPKHKSPSYRLAVSIYNTNKEMMDWLEERVDCCRYYKRQKSERHKPIHIIMVSAKSAEAFLLEVQPYIIAKTEQVKLALQLQGQVNHYRQEYPQTFPMQPISQEEINKREAIYQRMRQLNNGWKWRKDNNYQSILRRQI